MITCTRARLNLNFGLLRPLTLELAALERLKKSPYVTMGKTMSPLFSAVLDRILFILADNDYMHESLDEFEIRPDPFSGFHGNR